MHPEIKLALGSAVILIAAAYAVGPFLYWAGWHPGDAHKAGQGAKILALVNAVALLTAVIAWL